MEKYNIYSGLGGSFGGATYQGTGEFESDYDADEYAHELAIEEYQSYEGMHGILGWLDVADKNDLNPDDSNNVDEIDSLYQEEIENWIDYYAILTKEDTEITSEELIYL